MPTSIRNQLANNIYLIFKNKAFLKIYMENEVDSLVTFNNIYSVLFEYLQSQKHLQVPDNSISDANVDELQQICINILITALSLNTRKFHIPGETSEKAKLRFKCIEYGVLAVLTFFTIESRSESVRSYLQEDFFERIEE